MRDWWCRESTKAASAEHSLRARYASFRNLLSQHNDCLEILAGVQEDLRCVTASREVLGDRVSVVFNKLESCVVALEKLTGRKQVQINRKVRSLRNEIETEITARDGLPHLPVARWLSEVDRAHEPEVGSKTAALGEIRSRLMLPVPDGFVMTARAYHQFCGARIWKQIRDATRDLDLNDLETMEQVSAQLMKLVRECAIPRQIDVALAMRTRALLSNGATLAVRSSAVGEGGYRTFAGQFVSVLNVPAEGVVDAYREVVGSRFAPRALSYRLSAGFPEVDSPMAVLCMRMVPIRASGTMYTRDPGEPGSDQLWITSKCEVGPDQTGETQEADLFVMSRTAPYRLRERAVAREAQKVALLACRVLQCSSPENKGSSASLTLEDLCRLTEWGVRIEAHFGSPQDVEWAQDEHNHLWIVQSRQLALSDHNAPDIRSQVRTVPILSGGRRIHPGRVSGTAHLVRDRNSLVAVPPGSIVFLREASTEIVEIFPRISGLVAERGIVTGHAAALLREFSIPSVFQLPGVLDTIQQGELVSLDSVQPRIYRGCLWPQRNPDSPLRERHRGATDDLIASGMLTLQLVDPGALNFRAYACRSVHDVLRYCHERAIQSMFTLHDQESEKGCAAKRVKTHVPIDMYVIDLCNGLACDPLRGEVQPSEIPSRPFQALWRGVTHPDVTWTRDIAANLGDMVSVMIGSLTPSADPTRALGERSYLVVADDYMNLNSRLAYHFTLVDACASDTPENNYIAFRFAGGGSNRHRRSLRATFIEMCLSRYGFQVDRRGDLVNAWLKKMSAEETESHLDILGRLMACSSQLDMYMVDAYSPRSYADAFLEGNYSFQTNHPSVLQMKESWARRKTSTR